MKKAKKTKQILSILLTLLLITGTCFAAYAQGPGMPGGGTGSGSPSFSGATTIPKSTTKSGVKYTSNTGSQNALLVSGGSSSLSDVTVNKTGNSGDENADFYGTNAAVLAYNGATLNLSKATVTTDAGHANAVFAYGEGTIHISDSTITTSGNNSGAIMVTGGGTLTADNVTAETSGNSSAPIRSDRGGGTLTVNGGSYTANGMGSPAVYSTADITVNDATLKSTSAEGVVIEGANSVTLNNTNLTDNNTTLNGNSETYKNIFIYQSMSGDADEGVGSFTAKDSTITTAHGDSFFVTNTTAVITLQNNEIANLDSEGAFLRIQAGKWGNAGSNGGDVTLKATNQSISGDIAVDSISTLKMTLADGSTYTGTINSANSAKSIALTLDSSSTLVLTADSYITSLENELADNRNINLNGHTLFVNGEAITETAYEEAAASENAETLAAEDVVDYTAAEPEESGSTKAVIIICAIALAAAAGTSAVILVITRKKRNKAAAAQQAAVSEKSEE